MRSAPRYVVWWLLPCGSKTASSTHGPSGIGLCAETGRDLTQGPPPSPALQLQRKAAGAMTERGSCKPAGQRVPDGRSEGGGGGGE